MSEPDFISKVVAQTIAQQRVESWKKSRETIVFTNGVFDLLHPGHVIYLEAAKKLGTKLVVGINSDASTKTLNKGNNRPINDQDARSCVLAALASTDLIVIFDGKDPLHLIKALMPDVLVKGGDYTVEDIVGSKEVISNGGMVKSLPFLDGYSTSKIEQKIRGKG
ncbi:MAG: hypothetical protein Salg2KO_12780 [Salibacteraceae bacterium]